MKSFRRDKLQLMFKSKFNFKDPSTCKRGQVKSKQQRTWSGINRPEVIGPATQWSGLVLFLKNDNLGQAREQKILNFRTGPNQDRNHAETLCEQNSTEHLIGEFSLKNISCISYFRDRSKSFVIRHDQFPDLKSQVKKNSAI